MLRESHPTITLLRPREEADDISAFLLHYLFGSQKKIIVNKDTLLTSKHHTCTKRFELPLDALSKLIFKTPSWGLTILMASRIVN